MRARRPGGPETTLAAVRATLREGPAPSALNARGAESLRPWRLQRPLCPGPLEQHLGAGRPWLRIFSTFCPAQYNPAAAPLGGAWVPTAKGGERGGQGGLGSTAGAHQAEAVRLRGRRVSGRRLFVLGAPSSALRLPPMGRARGCGWECARPVRRLLSSGESLGHPGREPALKGDLGSWARRGHL